MLRCQASQPSEVLAAETALGGLHSNERGLAKSLAVGVLGIVPAAIASTSRARPPFRRSAGRVDDPLGLRRA